MRRILPLMVCLPLVVGCANYQYDEALQKRIEQEGQKRTKAWFARHLPDATDITIEMQYQMAFNLITNITEGTFSLGDSLVYDYVYNWESDSCLTTVGVTDSIPVETTLWGVTISNQDQFPYTHSTEERREPFSMSYNMVLMR